jgi:transcriptional/translational regulatory protein YebC/TACO1
LGKDGCLEFVFNRKGIFSLDRGEIDEDDFTLAMIEAGAEDVEFDEDEDEIIVTTEMEDFGAVQKKLQEIELEPKEAGLQRIPTTTKEISADTWESFSKLIDVLEDDDDIQKIYHNVEYDEEIMG